MIVKGDSRLKSHHRLSCDTKRPVPVHDESILLVQSESSLSTKAMEVIVCNGC
jgi:hypothetical protein